MKMSDLIKVLAGKEKSDEFEKITVKLASPEQVRAWLRKPKTINYPMLKPEGIPEFGIYDDGEFIQMSRTPYPGIRIFGELPVNNRLTPVSNATQTDQSNLDLSADHETISAPPCK